MCSVVFLIELWLVSMAVITIYEFDYREALVNMSQISHHACSNNITASKATLRVSCWIPRRKSFGCGFLNKQTDMEGGRQIQAEPLQPGT